MATCYSQQIIILLTMLLCVMRSLFKHHTIYNLIAFVYAINAPHRMKFNVHNTALGQCMLICGTQNF